jgi:hypothetical protein
MINSAEYKEISGGKYCFDPSRSNGKDLQSEQKNERPGKKHSGRGDEGEEGQNEKNGEAGREKEIEIDIL